MRKVRVAGVFLYVLLLLAVSVGCGSQPEVTQPTYTTVPVERGEVTRVLHAPGKLVLKGIKAIYAPASTRLMSLSVEPGDRVNKGEIIGTLDPEPMREAVAQARDNLRRARKELEKLRTPCTPAEMAKAEAAVQSAEAAVAAAKASLEEARSPCSSEDVIEAEAAVRDAEVALENARRSLITAQRNAEIAITDAEHQADDAYKIWRDFVWDNFGSLTVPSIAAQKDRLWWDVEKARKNLQVAKLNAESSIATAENNVAKAEETLREAKERLAKLKAGPDEKEIKEREAELAIARASLLEAKERLAKLKAGPDEEEVKEKEDKVAWAQIALDQALENLRAATIRAPCDGTVLEVKARPGEMLAKGNPILLLADLSQMQFMVTIAEKDILSVKMGMPADILLSALPGVALKGKVGRIIPQMSPTSQTVTYEVYLEPDEQPQGLLPDMTGYAAILVAEKHDVLRVPRRLVKIAPDGSGRVEVLEQGQPVFRKVVIGVRGDTYYEIVSGLSEGELVIQRGRF